MDWVLAIFKFVALAFSGGMIILVLWWARDIRYLYFLRVPLLTMIASLGLQVVAFSPGFNSLLENLFYGSTAWDFFWIILAAHLTTSSAYIIGQTVLQYGPMRFDREKTERRVPPFTSNRFLSAIISVPVVALFYVVLFKSGLQSAWQIAGFFGAIIASAMIYLFSVELVPLVRWLGAKLANLAIAILTRIPGGSILIKPCPALTDGYLDPETGLLLSGHIRNAVLLFFVWSSFVVLNFGARNDPNWVPRPALVYTFLILIFGSFLITAFTFFADRFRLPILLPAAVLFLLAAGRENTDHFFPVRPAPEPPASPSAIIAGRDRIIVVAAAGGGLQASAWTATVLSHLHEDVPGFAPALRVISSVSGGTVGTMEYVAERVRHPESGFAPGRVVAGAGTQSLDAVAWGLVAEDLWTALGFPRSNAFHDRGWALERVLAKSAQLEGTWLSAWIPPIAQAIPAVIFNATSVERGTPVVFSTARMPSGEGIENLLAKYDVKIATAARLSASFPFVTPVARPLFGSVETPSEHLADGGYYDNFGTASLYAWLRSVAQSGPRPRVLILRIVSFPNAKAAELHPASWTMQLQAPLTTMFNMRTAAQQTHSDTEFKLMRAVWPEGLEMHTVQYGPAAPDQEMPGGCDRPPLSWKLTSTELACLETVWEGSNAPDIVKWFLSAP